MNKFQRNYFSHKRFGWLLGIKKLYLNCLLYRALKAASSILLGVGLVIPVIAMAFIWWMRHDNETYLWVISGPYPFSHMGNGPFILWNGMGILILSGILIVLSLTIRKSSNISGSSRSDFAVGELQCVRPKIEVPKGLTMKIKRNATLLLVGIAGLIILAFLVEYITQSQGEKIRKNTKENFPSWRKINQFINNGWDFKIGETETEIRGNLGIPEIEIHTYEFFCKDGPYLEFINEAREGDKEEKVLISKLILDSSGIVDTDKYKTKWGLNLGSSKKRVKEVLGEPYKKERRKGWIPGNVKKGEEIWTYLDIEGPGSQVKFYFMDDTIHRIEWELYTG